jgi:hypothetical protein
VRLLVIGFVLALAVPAHAETFTAPPPDPAPALSAMKTYFKGEIIGGFTLIGMGAAGIGTGVGLYLAGDDNQALRGASYPALSIGVLHVAAGIFVGLGSVKRVKKFGTDITVDAEGWIEREQKRMKGVSTQFLVLEIVEGVGIAGGITMAAIGAQQDRPLLTGIGIALAVELGATLVFDIVAARRAKRYRSALGGITF